MFLRSFRRVHKIDFCVILSSSRPLCLLYICLLSFSFRKELFSRMDAKLETRKNAIRATACIRLFARERGSRSRHVHARVRAYRAYRFFTLEEYTRPRHTGCPHPFAICIRLIFTLRKVLSVSSKNYE